MDFNVAPCGYIHKHIARWSGLWTRRDAAGKHSTCGVVLYVGQLSTAFGDRLFAVPVRRLWETPV